MDTSGVRKSIAFAGDTLALGVDGVLSSMPIRPSSDNAVRTHPSLHPCLPRLHARVQLYPMLVQMDARGSEAQGLPAKRCNTRARAHRHYPTIQPSWSLAMFARYRRSLLVVNPSEPKPLHEQELRTELSELIGEDFSRQWPGLPPNTHVHTRTHARTLPAYHVR
jgi:hypothetical protein